MAATAIVGGLVIGAAGNYFASREQRKAAEEGIDATQQAAEEARLEAGLGQNAVVSNLEGSQPQIGGYLGQAYLGAQDALAQGYGQGRTDVLTAGGLSAGALTGAQTGALGSLQSGAAQGVGYLSGAQSGVDTALQGGIEGARGALGEQLGTQGISAYDVTGSQDRAGKMLDAGMYSGFEADPGYQFRLQQGEQAIMRAQAARGGRYGGATLKALQEHGQGLASQEFANFAARRGQEFGAASTSDAARAALNLDQAGRTDAAAQAAAQNRFAAGGTLAGMYGAAASQSAGAQQAFGSQAAGIATDTGELAAGIQTETGQGLADVYGRTGTQLAAGSQAAGAAYAGTEADYYKGLADLEWNVTGAENAATLGAAGVAAGQLPALAASNQAGVPYAGGGYAALGQLGQQAATLGTMYYSDQVAQQRATDAALAAQAK